MVVHKRADELQKAPTGIRGLDEITYGGLPKGRPTLLAGSAGSGKTLLAMEFLVRGATQYDEPGVYVSFEETGGELATNFATRGFDLTELEEQGKIAIDYVYIERSEIEETGEYDLEGLFIRLAHEVDKIGAKRVVLDTIEVLSAGLSNQGILRAELRRLFRWLKERNLTTIVTGERTENALTRYGLEEYVADCVILLDHRISEQVSTRRLRIVKYRGSAHGSNEYPFIIEHQGITVLPITSIKLDYPSSTERVSSGVEGLDGMLNGAGYYRGTSILVSGTAGTGKSTLAARFVDAASRRGERCLYFAFEEAESQIIRNMQSVGMNLRQWVDAGLLTFSAQRPTQYGLETHLAAMTKRVDEIKPSIVVVDPISNLTLVGSQAEVKAMLTRLIDFLKAHGITAMFTSLTGGEHYEDSREIGISTLMDTWISVRNIESNGERNRGIYVLKSRGMSHSNQVREFLLSDKGLAIRDVYIGPGGILAGTAREIHEARELIEAQAREQEVGAKRKELDRKADALEAKVAAMRAELESERLALEKFVNQQQLRDASIHQERLRLEKNREGSGQSDAGGEE